MTLSSEKPPLARSMPLSAQCHTGNVASLNALVTTLLARCACLAHHERSFDPKFASRESMSGRQGAASGGMGLPSFQDAAVFVGVLAVGAGIGLASAWWGWSDQSNLTANDAGVVEHFASGDEGEARRQLRAAAQADGESKSLDRKFHRAADAVRAHGSFTLDQKSKLYGLFKQATMGTCHSPAPSLVDAAAGFKWRAWRALGNTS